MFPTYHMEKAGNINRTTVHAVPCHTNILFFSVLVQNVRQNSGAFCLATQ